MTLALPRARWQREDLPRPNGVPCSVGPGALHVGVSACTFRPCPRNSSGSCRRRRRFQGSAKDFLVVADPVQYRCNWPLHQCSTWNPAARVQVELSLAAQSVAMLPPTMDGPWLASLSFGGFTNSTHHSLYMRFRIHEFNVKREGRDPSEAYLNWLEQLLACPPGCHLDFSLVHGDGIPHKERVPRLWNDREISRTGGSSDDDASK